jgi:DNA invertase Pin-like site-specific DNA recombinase
MEEKKIDRLIAYYRVSTEVQMKKDTIENQKVACREYAAKHNAVIIEEYEEPEGITGSSNERVEYLKARERLTMPDVDGLIVYAFDRWSRNKKRSTIDMLDLEETKKKIYMAQTDEVIDWTREGDDLIMQIKSWLAAKEREKIRARLAQGRERVKKGQSPKRPGKGWNSWKNKEIDMKEVERYLTMGVPKTFIAERLGVSRQTLYRKLDARARDKP